MANLLRRILAGHATLYRSPLSACSQVDCCSTCRLEVISRNRVGHVDHEAGANDQSCKCYHKQPSLGRMVHDVYLVQVKTPAESTGEWDLVKPVATIRGDDAFRPLADGGCPALATR